MNGFNDIRSVYHDEKLLFYDIFWIKSKKKVYIQAPLFLVGFNGKELKPEYPVNIKPYAKYPDMYPGPELIEDIFIIYGSCKAHFETHILGRACFMFVADLSKMKGTPGDVFEIELNYKIRGTLYKQFFSLPYNDRPKSDMAIGNMILNNNDIMDDWLHYHSMAEVDHFFFYDNGTKDKERLQKITSKYNCTIIPWKYIYFHEYPKGWPYDKTTFDGHIFGAQGPQQNHAIYKYCESFDWLAYIDVDEYLYPVSETSFKDIMSPLGNHAYLVANNTFYRTDAWNGFDRMYDKFLVREPIRHIPVEYKHSSVLGEINALYAALDRAKIIFNVNLLEDGDSIAIHVAMLVHNRDYHIFDPKNELRMNHYRKTPNHQSGEINARCTEHDDSLSKYVKDLEDECNNI